MSSLSGQQYNSKNMTGLSEIYSTNIVCDTIDIADELIVENGGIVTLPAASIQDSYLSANVAFRNQSNTFSQSNIFSNSVQFTSTIPVITQTIPVNDATTKIPTTSWVNSYYGKLTLATGSTLQTWFGSNRFSSNSANLPISLQNTDAPAHGGGMFIASGNGQYNANVLLNDTVLLATGTGSNTGSLSLTTWSSTPVGIRIGNNTIIYNGTNHNFNGTNNNFNGNISLALYNFDILNSGRSRGMRISNNGANNGITDIEGVGVSTRFNFYSSDGTGTRLNNFFISDSNTCYLQGATGLGIGLTGSAISLDGVCSFTNTTTPVITQTIATIDNSTKIVTSAWVRLQNYITTAALSGYALLSGPQTFTGNQNFVTQATTDNSTLAATTAYVKGQNYITSSALSGYALLSGPQTFTGNQNFVTQATTDNSTLCATTAYVKGQNYITSAALSGYALLAPSTTQTFAGTGDNVFSNIVTFNVGLQSNNNITMYSIGGGGQTSNIQQTNSGLTIRNINNSNSIVLETRTSGGVSVENIKCQNGNNTTINGSLTMNNDAISFKDVLGGSSFTQLYQSGSGFVITPNHSSSQVTISTKTSGGVSVENIKCQNGNNTTINGSLTMNNDAISFKDVSGGSSSTSIYQSGVACSITNNFNNGSVRLNTKNGGGVGQDNVYALNGNQGGLQGNSGKTIQVVGNDATINCDTFTSYAPYTCGYNTLGTLPTKTNNQIGYVWSVQGSSFNSWSGFTSYGNVYTLAWNGTGDRTYGVWLCDICIATQTSSAMDSGFVFSVTNNFVINTRSAWSNALTSFGVNQAQIVRLSCVLNITNLTDTYYLNFKINGGSSRSDLTGASQMLFTRIA